MVTTLSPADRLRISAAVVAAERGTDAEIVTIVAPASDAYHDVVLHWAIVAMLAAIALLAVRPDWIVALGDRGWNGMDAPADLLAPSLFVAAAILVVTRFIVGMPALRYRFVPGATRARRVRRRAIMLFRVGVQHHTADRNGVLLYLSLAERRAEIVTDRAVHAAVAPEIWGDILADLLLAVRAGQAGDAMVAAVTAIGATLATRFPHSGGDPAELPDRLIQL